MQWRMLIRRVPSRSMTVVGDVAQTGSAAGTTSWAESLDQHAEGRWLMEELTVNYRTPARIVELATSVLTAAGQKPGHSTTARERVHEPARRLPEQPWQRQQADAQRRTHFVGQGGRHRRERRQQVVVQRHRRRRLDRHEAGFGQQHAQRLLCGRRHVPASCRSQRRQLHR